jgi:HAD superfamily hydrolase (TIGR01662 family)
MPNHPTTIFFDVGNTLLFPDRKTLLAPLGERDITTTLDHWRAVECDTKKRFDDVMQHGGPADHGFWSMFFTQFLGELGVVDETVRLALVEGIRNSANWCDMRPGTREALKRLGQHYRLAVISNADGKVSAVLDRCGILDCFETVTDSGNVGCEKPNPAIFRSAMEEMNARPEASLYVGDVYSVDYLGATRAGMQAILFDVAGAYRDAGLPRVESLEELEASLRLGRAHSPARF